MTERTFMEDPFTRWPDDSGAAAGRSAHGRLASVRRRRSRAPSRIGDGDGLARLGIGRGATYVSGGIARFDLGSREDGPPS
jgi:hypothetical protein